MTVPKRGVTTAECAASSESPEFLTRRGSRTSGSTPCSIGARRAPASSPSTSTAGPGHTAAWGSSSENFHDAALQRCLGDVAVGHTRYSTAGSSVLANAQPLLIDYRGGPLTIAHNGNLTNAPELRRELVDQGAIFTTSTDTEVLLHLIARSRKHTPEEQIREALEQVEGAYTLLMSVGRTHLRGRRLPRLPSRWCSAGWAAGWSSPRRPARSTWSAPDGLRAASRASSSGSKKARSPSCPGSSPGRSAAACSSWSTSPAPTARVFGESVDRVRRELGRAAGAGAPGARAPRSCSACRTAPTRWRSASPRSRASSWSTA